eukprot:gene17756-biopygen11107
MGARVIGAHLRSVCGAQRSLRSCSLLRRRALGRHAMAGGRAAYRHGGTPRVLAPSVAGRQRERAGRPPPPVATLTRPLLVIPPPRPFRLSRETRTRSSPRPAGPPRRTKQGAHRYPGGAPSPRGVGRRARSGARPVPPPHRTSGHPAPDVRADGAGM